MEQSPRLQTGMQIGDYLLKELISEGSATRTWYADQVSVRREVIVDSLRSAILKNDDVREAFLADVRAKASVDHPLIGSVFEAVKLDDVCFYARERLSGETLERLAELGEKMTPSEVVKILKQLAEANLYLERQNIGSIPVGPHQIYIDDKHLARMVNMAIGEKRDHAVSTEDKATIGQIFLELLDTNQPGATRVSSLCGFMVDKTREIPITWDQILELSEQVEKQLREQATAEPKVPTVSLKDKELHRNTFIVLGAVAVVILVAFASVFLFTSPKKTHPRDLSQMVAIEMKEVNLGKRVVKVRPFEIDAHEVTIAEYAEFLRNLETEGADRFKDPEQPSDISSYVPHDWENMYEAAKNGKIWDNRKMDVNQPVANVNWWSAKAYANWMTYSGSGGQYDLPTEAQWKAVIDSEDIEKLVVGPWTAADKVQTDITSNKIHGLAGGVSEWTKTTELNVDGSEKLPVVLGASYSSPTNGASKRDIVRSKSVIRSDLGFRLVKK